LNTARHSVSGFTDSLGNAFFSTGVGAFGGVVNVIDKVSVATLGNATFTTSLSNSASNIGTASAGSFAMFAGARNGSTYYSSLSRMNLTTGTVSENIGFLSTQMAYIAGCSGD